MSKVGVEQWTYQYEGNTDSTKYEIYRAINNYSFDLYTTIKQSQLLAQPDQYHVWTDYNVLHGRKYSYKIVAVNNNNTTSKVSNVVSAILQ